MTTKVITLFENNRMEVWEISDENSIIHIGKKGAINSSIFESTICMLKSDFIAIAEQIKKEAV